MHYVLYIVVALLITAFVLIVITPSNKDGKINKVFQCLHDFFNFKKMYITIVLKAIVIFLTVFSIIYGFRLMFGFNFYGYHYNTFWQGLALMILGPVVVRLSYEVLWLSINAAIATIQIRDKLNGKEESKYSDFDDALNSAEKFGNKVYKETKKFSSEAIDAASKKINEMKENRQSKEENKSEENTEENSDDQNNTSEN